MKKPRFSPASPELKALNLSQRKTNWTEEQKAGVVKWYVTLPMTELRLRQDFNNQYIGMIHTEHTRFGFKTSADPMEPRLANALADIRIDEDLLVEAIWRKNFGDESWNEWVNRDNT